jgi:hypothetical protein
MRKPAAFSFLLLLSLQAPARADTAPADEQREQCQLAIAEDVNGSIDVVSTDGSKAELVKDGAVQPGDLVRTGAGSWADLRLCDGTGLRVGENSKFYYEGADNERESFAAWAFRLVRGSLRAAVVSSGNGDRVKLRVRTASASLGVRGTEFVVDSDDAGDWETSLHTLEGEVLMGPEADFDKLARLRGAALTQEFEPVGQEKMSVIHRNEARPLRAAMFKLWEFRAARRGLLNRPLPKRGWTEIRGRFREVHQKLKKRRLERGLFERPREKIEEKVQEARPDRALRRQESTAEPPEAAAGPRDGRRVQDKPQGERRQWREERRQRRLEGKLQENKQKATDKRLRKGWRKNLDGRQSSPRMPDLGK